MIAGGSQLLLGLLDLGIDLCSVLSLSGDVQQAGAVIHPVDTLRLGLEGCGHHGELAPAGGQQQAGGHAQLGIDLPDQL